MSQDGRRTSARESKRPDRYGDLIETAPPKTAQKKAPKAKSAGSSITSSMKLRRIDLEFKKDVEDLSMEHRKTRVECKALELIITHMKEDLEDSRHKIEALRLEETTDAQQKQISEELVKVLHTESCMKQAERDLSKKQIQLEFAAETLKANKEILKDKADIDKLEIEQEDEKSQKNSVDEISQIDKHENTSNWARKAAKKMFDPSIVSTDDESVWEEPESEKEEPRKRSNNRKRSTSRHKSTNVSTSDKLLARQIQGRDLPFFSGKVEEWPIFLTAFETSTKNCQYSDAENLVRLQRCLKGEAQELVQCLLVDPRGVKMAMEELKKRFGRPGIILKSMVNKLKEVPDIKMDRYDSWVKIGVGVRNLVATIESLGAYEQLSNPTLVEDLAKKLPPQKAMDWEEYKVRKKMEFPKLDQFSKWLQPIVEAAYALCPPGASGESKTSSSKDKTSYDRKKPYEKKGYRSKQERVYVTTERTDRKDHQHKGPKRSSKCTICEEEHAARNCSKIKELDLQTRWEIIKEKKACFNCLDRGHRNIECGTKKECGVEGCSKIHHPLLHFKPTRSRPPQARANEGGEAVHTTEEQAASPDAEVTFVADQGSRINYNVIPVQARRNDGSLMQVYIALDGYSSLTSSDEETRKKLGITGTKRPLTVKGFQATTTTQDSYVIDIEIVSQLDGHSYILKNVKTVPKLDLPRQSCSVDTIRKFGHLKNIPIQTYKNVKPTILVGMDHFELHLQKEVKLGGPGEPVGIRTAMGWAVVGPTSRPPVNSEHAYHISERIEDPLHHLVKQFFTTEYVGVKPNLNQPRSKEDLKAQGVMDSTIRRVSDGWESGLLWRDENAKLPCNKQYAFQRLKSMERKMDKDPEFAKQYVERIREYQDKGFTRVLSPEEASLETDKTFYLPHFMAYNEKKPKKYRFVFDAAAKVYGRSLNDHLLQGPDKLVSLPGALLKFRQRKVGVTADIKDMFHRVKIRKEDASAQRFLWRELDRDRDPDVMEMGVLIFGASCSPACAQEVKNKNAEEFKEEFPEAYEAIVHRHYMDDLLDSYDTEEKAIQLQQEITEVHKRGSFNICNWLSSSKAVMQAIPEELRAKSMQSLDFNWEDQMERVLGLFWMPEQDEFTFCLKYLKAEEDILNGTRMPSKRQVLSLVMSVFDPLGYVATLTVKAKMILQQTWKTEIGWDDEIPTSTHKAWRNWLEQLSRIPEFKIPRCYAPNISTSDNVQLHIFGDASEEAFGAVAYFRIETNGQVSTALVMAKTNVAPIKHLTIPRLELQAAVIGARLAAFLHQQHEIKIHRTVFWSDSRTVLGWIRADGKQFQQFVGNRIGEIQELTDVSQWKWIPTAENVADELTRMDQVCDWTPESRWVNGPSFLLLEEKFWPNEDRFSPGLTDEAMVEMKKEQVLHITEKFHFNASDYSSWRKLLRVTAYVRRFLYCYLKKDNTKGPLTPSEIEEAQTSWSRKVQSESFKEDIDLLKRGRPVSSKGKLKGLSVQMENELLRVGGRLENSDLPTCTKRPVILDSKHPYTKLLVRHFHEICGHHGQERIANELRQQFHIIGLRTAVRTAQSHCQLCKNRRAIPIPPEMGQLPKFRVENPGIPFHTTGLDYFGPINVVVKRSNEKRYVALFTCLCTRAVHLELAGSLSTDSCIMALRRFVARRGCPKSIHSDNGTNFHGACNELKSALQELDQDKLNSTCNNLGIQWSFLAPSSPHMAGSWERMVRSVKIAMGATLEMKNLHEEVLNTVLAEAEHTVNSHPLTHVPVDPNDPDVLTPNHFLLHRSSNLQPIGKFDRQDLYGRKEWRIVQAMADNFWKRWIKEYLPTLLRRQKWFQSTKPIQIGDIVLEVNDNLPRNSCPMGRVTELFPGKDGIVRVVEIKLANCHVFRRPVAKLCILDVQPPKDQDQQQDNDQDTI